MKEYLGSPSFLFVITAGAWLVVIATYLYCFCAYSTSGRNIVYRRKNFRFFSYLMIILQLAVLYVHGRVEAYPQLASRLEVVIGNVSNDLSVVRVAAGLILLASGCYLCCAARLALGNQWDRHASVSADHELLTRGVYGYSRNPLYLGQLLILFGVFVSYPTPLIGLAAFMTLVSHYSRVINEETVLGKHFGDGYKAYAESVPRLVPGSKVLARLWERRGGYCKRGQAVGSEGISDDFKNSHCLLR
jgi:protein-S-isoprenylcysteine O-methyltransferase Ste14